MPDEVQALNVRYYDNSLDETGLSRLREAMMGSASTRAIFVRWGVHGEVLSESLSANYQEAGEDVWRGSPSVLAELGWLEQQAEASMVQLHHLQQPWHRSPWLIGFGSLAAVVAIALLLVVVFTGPNGSPPIAQDTNEPGTISPTAPPAISPIVATLTAERDAVWDRRPGGDLYAGQRLTLTQGFAEIRTKRGAVVYLEAPATIGFLDHENAVYLYAGKLVGFCDTVFSKGFTVKTDHAEVIDLGTEFGVSVRGQQTQVHVYQGEVTVAPKRVDGFVREPLRLTDRQGAVVKRDDHQAAAITRTAFDSSGFHWYSATSLDLVDIVAGGDGTGQRGGAGIDLRDGQRISGEQMAAQSRRLWEHYSGSQVKPVNGNDLIDSVFVIDVNTGTAVVSSRGKTISVFPTKQAAKKDAFGHIQAVRDGLILTPKGGAAFEKPFASQGNPALDARFLVINSSSGITFDLDSIRSRHPRQSITRFTAQALSIEALSRQRFGDTGKNLIDFWVIVDDDVRLSRKAISTEDGIISIDLAINEEDRYLSLATSAGGDATTHDWFVLSVPDLELRNKTMNKREAAP